MGQQKEASLTEVGLVARIVSVIIGSYLLAQLGLHWIDADLGEVGFGAIEATVIVLASTAALWWGLVKELPKQYRAQQFDHQLQTALQMAGTEAAGYDVVRRAIDATDVRGRAQLMLADSSEAHLKTAVDYLRGDDTPGCSVTAPFDCPAIQRAQTSRFASNLALDACPWLVNRPGAEALSKPIGAICVPLNVVGRAIGVLHVTGPSATAPSETTIRNLESIAEKAGARIGLLRVMTTTHLQAATDPLTGLLNRRSLENRLHDLIRGQESFALAMGDLDLFKAVNDTHGHDAGDRALRVFARTVRSSLRAEDIASRYGGEEFVFVFPGLSAQEAARVLERMREALALALHAGAVPTFTASFGVAESLDADSVEDLIRLADTALFNAKRQGRNRVVIDAVR